MTFTDDEIAARFDAAVTATTIPDNRYDVTIVCTTDDHQAEFWMSKLKTSSSSSSAFPMVIAVSEDWSDPSGAGNGLGTLYAWQKACRYAKTHFSKDHGDLDALLQSGAISAALYHTAGKGTRLAPLPASENNNKPGVVSVYYYYVEQLVYCNLVVFSGSGLCELFFVREVVVIVKCLLALYVHSDSFAYSFLPSCVGHGFTEIAVP
jgi:hypothetical protein